MPPALLSGLALVASAGAGGLALWALARPLPEPQPCDCKAQLPAVVSPSTSQAELAELRVRVEQLERQRTDRLPVAPMSGAAPTSAALPEPPPTRFVRFIAPSPALGVEQAPNGSISVHNTDAALTGQVLVIEAVAEDGGVYPVTIVVPAPE